MLYLHLSGGVLLRCKTWSNACLQLWTEYLPNSEISFVEYNAACGEKYREIIQREGRGNLYIGDQANVTFLKSIIDDQAGRVFDVIIDDGENFLSEIL